MKNVINVNEIPYIKNDVMMNPAIQVILNGALATIKAQSESLNGTYEENYVPFMAFELAKSILFNCQKSFNELLHYTICYQECEEIPFLIQHNFFHAYDSALMELNAWTRADVIVAQAFDVIEEYVQLLFKVAVLIEVESGNTGILTNPKDTHFLKDSENDKGLIRHEEDDSDILEAMPVDETGLDFDGDVPCPV